MGMFDSVYVHCPDCNARIEMQSKAGKCMMDEFGNDEIPADIAADIHGDCAFCDACQTSWRVFTSARICIRYKARLVEDEVFEIVGDMQ